ncbi:hypothetical protein AERO_18495, partial [Aeromicrobium fastidiosum]|uniref:hypothetical protein n=1 Tax=Aeromicrobium fastidiosum TaxID=52699 RepID=UPI00403F3A57|nr:hypothetical protein [Aeromicrobium fastidiosum]
CVSVSLCLCVYYTCGRSLHSCFFFCDSLVGSEMCIRDRRDAAARVEAAQEEARRVAEKAEQDARQRVAAAEAEAERVTLQSKRDAQERLSQAVAAARSAAEEKLQEAERTALEWVAAAEAEAERVAQAHIVMANHSSAATPLSAPQPLVDEYVDEAPAQHDGDDRTPEEVSDESGALAPKIKKRVVRRR